MMLCGQYVNMTATGAVFGNRAQMLGFYVNSTSSGTLVFRDGGASGTTVSGTITPAIGWHFFPMEFAQSPHVTVGGTINVTFSIAPV